MMDGGLNLSQEAQNWVNLILIWLGFGTLVAIVVRCLFPGKEPTGMISSIMIGIVGTCVGPLIVSTIWRIENFNPISPVGFLASIICAALFLLFYQIGITLTKRRRNEYHDRRIR
jgi:uncharacterized membrane protein YeaQ/YmgE (transglycosylase-associated protein family)